jgi:hypothetical protein
MIFIAKRKKNTTQKETIRLKKGKPRPNLKLNICLMSFDSCIAPSENLHRGSSGKYTWVTVPHVMQ